MNAEPNYSTYNSAEPSADTFVVAFGTAPVTVDVALLCSVQLAFIRFSWFHLVSSLCVMFLVGFANWARMASFYWRDFKRCHTYASVNCEWRLKTAKLALLNWVPLSGATIFDSILDHLTMYICKSIRSINSRFVISLSLSLSLSLWLASISNKFQKFGCYSWTTKRRGKWK